MRIGRPRLFGLPCCLFAAGTLLCCLSLAQEITGPVEVETPVPTGDVVHLKGGSSLTGVQVLRVGTFVVEIQTLKGLAPLALPKSQVASIEYDSIDPNSLAVAQNTAKSSQKVVTGTKLSKDFDRKLFAPLPEAVLQIKDADFVPYIAALAEKLEIPVQISDAVRAIPPGQRIWSADVATGSSFITLLQDNLVKAFPQLSIVFHSDGIELVTREEQPVKEE